MNNTNKEKFGALMKIAEFNIHQYNERRNYSWKITLTFWSAIIGGFAIVRDNILEKIDVSLCSLILFGVVVFGFHNYWLYNVFVADKKDKNLAFEARDKAISKIGVELKFVPEFDPDRKFLSDWSAIFQLLVTLLLIFVIGWLVVVSQ